jgi:hypothetical protein
MRRRKRGTVSLQRVSTAIVLALVVGWSPTAAVASPVPSPDARAMRRDELAEAESPAEPEPARAEAPAEPEPARAEAPPEPEPARAEAPAEPEPARSESPAEPEPARAEPPADDADAASSEPPEPAFKVGGELVFAHNVSLSPLDRTGGAFVMNRFGVRLGGSYGKLGFFAKYLFQDFGHYPRVGYLSYQALPSLQLQAGIINHPFGPLPFLTDGFIFGLAYIVGLEDDADAGVKLVYQHRGFDLRLAYMHSDERGGSSLVRWGADLVTADIDRDGEPDGLGSEGPQASARIGYALERSNGGVEFALSGRGGMIVERGGVGRGSHVAGGAHFNGHWRDRFRVKLFGSYQDHFTGGEPVVYGAIGAAYAVAPRSATGQANVSWTEHEVGKLDSISVYNDFSAIFKVLDDSRPTMINVAGVGFRLGPAYIHVEWLAYQNHPLFDSNGLEGLTIGPETRFSHRLTTNLGFEFL